MKIKMFQVDAFTNKLFSGNPAAVCILNKWLSDKKMQKIAAENNLAETAFLVFTKENIEIRWFTPTTEVELCGHATLAAAHVLFKHFHFSSKLVFSSKFSGDLYVEKENKQIVLNFPTDKIKESKLSTGIIEAIGLKPIEVYKGSTDYLLIYKNQKEIEQMQPNFDLLSKVNSRGVIVSAKGDSVDFVSRFFAPQVGINEDPVTGSAHTSLTPYWSRKLNKISMKAIQLSDRKGYLECVFLGDRVSIAGKAVTFFKGTIKLK